MESDFLNKDKLEKLLIANWAQFLNSSKLIGYVLTTVKSNIDRFVIISNSKITPKGVSITLSRCDWTVQGFIIWVEFSVPISSDKIAEGTTELCLSHNGTLTHISTLGNIFIA